MPPHEASGTWLGVDVPEFVRNSFPTNRNRNAWATWGFSAGGWCAAVVASQHPNTFSAAASLVGYFKPDFEPGYQPFAPSSAQYRAADLVALMKKSPPNVAYYVLAAEQDELSYPTSAQFAAAVRAPASVQTRLLSHGGHQGNVWIPYLAESIDFLGKASGFKATQP